MITVALVGDVMLGRGVNETLRSVRPEEPWGDVLPALGSADLRIANLECAITGHDRPWTRTPRSSTSAPIPGPSKGRPAGFEEEGAGLRF